MAEVEVHGKSEDDFAAVSDAFAANFADDAECGASLVVTLEGRPVVDIWAGDADTGGRPWQRDTLVNVWSTTKTMAGTCMLMLADRGLLDFDAPVAAYWPEFAQNGKHGVLVKHVMAHQAGLPGLEPPTSAAELCDRQLVVDRLEAMSPWWPPGTEAGYHAVTQGFLQGEILRRIDGRTLGTFFREEVAVPLGADFHIGLPPTEHDRVAELVAPEVMMDEALADAGVELDPIAARVMASGKTGRDEIAMTRTKEWREAEIPAAGGTGNARSVGRVHSALANGGAVDGVELLSPAGVERVLEQQFDGTDKVMGGPMRYGMGFGLMSPDIPLSPNERAFFWGGWGGSIAVIDLDARLTVSYVMNKMATDLLGDMRGVSLVFATYGCL